VTLSETIAKLESAPAGNRALDKELSDAIGLHPPEGFGVPWFTTSDEALALFDLLPQCEVVTERLYVNNLWQCRAGFHGGRRYVVTAATAALAICSCALRAWQSHRSRFGGGGER
jgi:hypothetical protein